eukprot:scaffold25661_cov101-Isochrysis_galbana.AAC.1
MITHVQRGPDRRPSERGSHPPFAPVKPKEQRYFGLRQGDSRATHSGPVGAACGPCPMRQEATGRS